MKDFVKVILCSETNLLTSGVARLDGQCINEQMKEHGVASSCSRISLCRCGETATKIGRIRALPSIEYKFTYWAPTSAA